MQSSEAQLEQPAFENADNPNVQCRVNERVCIKAELSKMMRQTTRSLQLVKTIWAETPVTPGGEETGGKADAKEESMGNVNVREKQVSHCSKTPKRPWVLRKRIGEGADNKKLIICNPNFA